MCNTVDVRQVLRSLHREELEFETNNFETEVGVVLLL